MNKKKALVITLTLAIVTVALDKFLMLGIANTLSDFLIIFLALGLGLSLFGVKTE